METDDVFVLSIGKFNPTMCNDVIDDVGADFDDNVPALVQGHLFPKWYTRWMYFKVFDVDNAPLPERNCNAHVCRARVPFSPGIGFAVPPRGGLSETVGGRLVARGTGASAAWPWELLAGCFWGRRWQCKLAISRHRPIFREGMFGRKRRLVLRVFHE